MAESFVFYESFQTAIERLPENMQLEMYRAIVAYGINGEVYEGLKQVPEEYRLETYEAIMDYVFGGVEPSLA